MSIKAFRLSMRSAALVAVSIVMAAALTTAAWSNPGTGTAPVREQNVDGSGAIKVHEQGTANVNVTNSSVPVTVGNFPSTQQVAGNVTVGNFPETQRVAGTVNVGNLPATQDVNVVGGAIATSFPVTNAGFESGLIQLEKLTSQQIAVDPPIFATTVSLNLADKEHTQVSFKGSVPGCGFCTLFQIDARDESPVYSFTTPIRVDRIDVVCINPGAFLDHCLPQVFIAGLKS